MIKSKADLKALFRKNSVPSEGDFADLIESGLNQSDDGIRKGPGDPLSVVAGGETQELFSFYNSADAKQPGWKINQNPPNGSAGFNIYNDAKGSCLFIGENTGKIGIGEQTPKVKLTVNGAVHVGMENDGDLFKKGQGLYLNWNYSNHDGETNFINSKGGGEGGFNFQNTDGSTLSDPLLYIRGNGNVGIGVGINASCKLDVGGDIKASGSLTSASLEVNGEIRATGSLTSKGITLTDSGAIRLIDENNIPVATTDLGLYSTKAGYNMRLVTNRAPILFYTEALGQDGSGNNNAMVITLDGNVGIGTASGADAKLHVRGNVKVEGEINATGPLISTGITLTDRGVIRVVDEKNIPVATNDLGLYSTKSGYNMRLVTNKANILFFTEAIGEDGSGANNAMVITLDGNVGIGTGNDANARLHVKGAVKLGQDRDPDYYKKGAGAYIHWNGYNKGEMNFMNNRGDQAGGFVFNNFNDSDIAYPLLNMKGNGMVSIGDDPSANARLDVRGNIRVSGDKHDDYKDYSKSQGAYITWNLISGEGNTVLINNFGGAPTWHRGFVFKEYDSNGNSKVLARITPSKGIEAEAATIESASIKTLTVNGQNVTGSDHRIKKGRRTADGARNLQILKELKIEEYSHIDPQFFGDKLRKGLIAQEVEKVFPEAVLTRRDFIPDILATPKEISEESGVFTFTMHKPHKLVNADIVKIQAQNRSVPKSVTYIDDVRFSVEGTPHEYEGDVLVYGRQVDDFKMVEYDRLYLLNLSATQELIKKLLERDAKFRRLADDMRRRTPDMYRFQEHDISFFIRDLCDILKSPIV